MNDDFLRNCIRGKEVEDVAIRFANNELKDSTNVAIIRLNDDIKGLAGECYKRKHLFGSSEKDYYWLGTFLFDDKTHIIFNSANNEVEDKDKWNNNIIELYNTFKTKGFRFITTTTYYAEELFLFNSNK